jgi:hypothetical protein
MPNLNSYETIRAPGVAGPGLITFADMTTWRGGILTLPSGARVPIGQAASSLVGLWLPIGAMLECSAPGVEVLLTIHRP